MNLKKALASVINFFRRDKWPAVFSYDYNQLNTTVFDFVLNKCKLDSPEETVRAAISFFCATIHRIQQEETLAAIMESEQLYRECNMDVFDVARKSPRKMAKSDDWQVVYEICGFSSHTEMARQSLALMAWAVMQIQEGRIIAFVNEHLYHEISYAPLNVAKPETS